VMPLLGLARMVRSFGFDFGGIVHHEEVLRVAENCECAKDCRVQEWWAAGYHDGGPGRILCGCVAKDEWVSRSTLKCARQLPMQTMRGKAKLSLAPSGHQGRPVMLAQDMLATQFRSGVCRWRRKCVRSRFSFRHWAGYGGGYVMSWSCWPAGVLGGRRQS
jgi:hypothetical protein